MKARIPPTPVPIAALACDMTTDSIERTLWSCPAAISDCPVSTLSSCNFSDEFHDSRCGLAPSRFAARSATTALEARRRLHVLLSWRAGSGPCRTLYKSGFWLREAPRPVNSPTDGYELPQVSQPLPDSAQKEQVALTASRHHSLHHQHGTGQGELCR